MLLILKNIFHRKHKIQTTYYNNVIKD